MGFNSLSFGFLALIIKLKTLNSLLFGVQENFSPSILYAGEGRRKRNLIRFLLESLYGKRQTSDSNF